MAGSFVLTPGALTLGDLRAIHGGRDAITLDPACHAGIDDARRAVEATLAGDEALYGVNTGFGALARSRIDADRPPRLLWVLSPLMRWPTLLNLASFLMSIWMISPGRSRS